MIVWRDGSFIEADAAIAASDRGFLIGDGVFETVLVDNGKPAFLAAHLARLARGADALAIHHAVTESAVRSAIGGLAGRLGIAGRAACRITLTRVGGARGLAPSKEARAQLLITLQPAPPVPPHLHIIVAKARRFSGAATNGFKCIGAYAPHLLARLEAAHAGVDEALMLNEHGRLACASASNVFVLSVGILRTPPESEGAMPGVTRALLLQAAAAGGVETRIEPIGQDALASGTLLLTNSLIGVCLASAIDGTKASADLASRLASSYDAILIAENSEPSP